MSFDTLGLSPELLRVVAQQGYTEPTPVQTQAIPLVLDGRDVLAGAQTGTGKTAAFVLPMLQRLHASRPTSGPRVIRALILTPTRELALQVEESVRTYGAQNPIKSTTIYGGVGFDPQVRALRAGPEIVVATPGRLLDHLGQRTIDLSRVEILVLDEADRMLDMGFIRDIRKVLAVLPPRRQNLLFSATFSDEIRRLADGLLDNPASVQVTPRNTPTELVTQVVHMVDRERKRELLSHLIKTGRIDQALVFTRTKHGANRLALQLGHDGILATAIHGNKSQPQRVRALADFKAGRFAVLVATEVAARGLDIEALPHVVNFELPMVPEDYVHRIGRTGSRGCRWRCRLARLRRRAQAAQRHRARPRPRHPARDDPGLRARSAHPTRADPARRAGRIPAVAIDVRRRVRHDTAARRDPAAVPGRVADTVRWVPRVRPVCRPSRPGARHATPAGPRPGGPRPGGARPGGSRPGNRGAGFAGPRRPGQGIGNGAGPRPASGGQRSGPRTGGDGPSRSDGRGGGYGQPRPSNKGTVMPGERLARQGGRRAADPPPVVVRYETVRLTVTPKASAPNSSYSRSVWLPGVSGLITT